jgi:hypothetical protein
MQPSAPRGAVFDNTFESAAGPIQAGTSFALALTGLPPLLITCQHLFGPAGGVSKDVPPAFMPRFVPSVSIMGALADGVTARAGAAVLVPEADAAEPSRDLAAFPLEANDAVRPLRIASPSSRSRVFLAARLRKGAPPGVFLFPAEHVADHSDGTSTVLFDDPAIHMPGTSGAPVLNEAGEVTGMVVRFRVDAGTTTATLLAAPTIDALLRAVTWPPPKRGLWNKLFG